MSDRCLAPIAVLLGVLSLLATALGDDAALHRAIERLSSEVFNEREMASETLLAAGDKAIPLLEEAAAKNELETTSRILGLLEMFAVDTDNPAARDAARGALSHLSASKSKGVAGRATAILAAIQEVERTRAIDRLETLGAVLKTRQLIGPAFIPAELSVEIGPDWRGTDDDLKLLAHITDLRALVLVGPQVSDAWLKSIAALDSLRTLRIKKGKITAEGLSHLKRLTELQALEILYVPLDDESLRPLAEMLQLSQVRLFGTKVSKPAGEKLAADLPTAKIDIRRGGFLGIGVEPHPLGCVIKRVESGSVAERTGLEFGDVILTFEGKRPRDFTELTQVIGEYEPGAEVTLELYRNGEREKRKLTLGEWE